MEWWEIPNDQYDSFVNEGVLKAGKYALGGYLGYKAVKHFAPKAVRGAVDAYHGARDFANQTSQRIDDPQSHKRPDGYRYPSNSQPNPNDKQVKEGWDGYTIDEYGNPVVYESNTYEDEAPAYEGYVDEFGYSEFGMPVYEDAHKRNKQIEKAEQLGGVSSRNPKATNTGQMHGPDASAFKAGSEYGHDRGEVAGWRSGYKYGKDQGVSKGYSKGYSDASDQGRAALQHQAGEHVKTLTQRRRDAKAEKREGSQKAYAAGRDAANIRAGQRIAALNQQHAETIQGLKAKHKATLNKATVAAAKAGKSYGFAKGKSFGRWQGAAMGAAGAAAAYGAYKGVKKLWAKRNAKKEEPKQVEGKGTPVRVKGTAYGSNGYGKYQADGQVGRA